MIQDKSFAPLLELFEEKINARSFDREFCALLARAFDAELASILDMEGATGTLKFRHSLDIPAEAFDRFRFRLGEGVCGSAAQSGKIVTLFDASPASPSTPKVEIMEGKPVRSLLAVPVIHQGRVAGVIEIMNKRSGEFDDGDKLLARAAAALYASRRFSEREDAPAKTRKTFAPAEGQPILVGSCAAMERVLRLILRAAPTDLPVLILGETGTGKELVARRIHDSSARRGRPFAAINCAALSETLLESELFGHVRGAFTGAHADRAGRLEEANGGTVFLDEIGDMSKSCQAKLLRALDAGEITPVGSNRVRKINIRLVAATNRPLEKMIRAEQFRADLFYRLRGVELHLPPLRERGSDISSLAEFFLHKVNQERELEIEGFLPETTAALMSHDWPGNVRELRHAVEEAATMTEGTWIRAQDLPAAIRGESSGLRTGSVRQEEIPANQTPSHGGEREKILIALKETAYAGTGRWNFAKAAKLLGMNRKTLEYRARKIFPKQTSE